VRAIVTGAVQPLVTADKVRPRLLETPNAGLLMVFNDGIEDQRPDSSSPRGTLAPPIFTTMKPTRFRDTLLK